MTDDARHYLRDVLRLQPGAAVELFDGKGGAWEAVVEPGFAALAQSAMEVTKAGEQVMAARDRNLAGHKAASTLIPVPALAQPEWKVEISVVAARQP